MDCPPDLDSVQFGDELATSTPIVVDLVTQWPLDLDDDPPLVLVLWSLSPDISSALKNWWHLADFYLAECVLLPAEWVVVMEFMGMLCRLSNLVVPLDGLSVIC
jgi:hypothetical protein